jgi:septal ring factor EnvC (AmiA/AmiB activator)
MLLLMAFLLLPASALAGRAEASKEALDQLQSRIETLKKELDSTEEAHSEAADALKQSEQAISEANRQLHELLLRQRENSNTLQSLALEKSGLEQTIRQQQELLGKQLYQQYLDGHQGYTQIILSQRDPAAIARELHYLGYVSRARYQLIESLKTNLGHVAQLNEETASTLREIAALKTEQEQQRKELQAKKTERRNVMQKLAKQIKSQRGEISKLKRDEKRLSQLVERLSRIVLDTPKRSRDTDKTRRNEALPTAALAGLDFEALKGRLHLPVRGNVTNRFGTTREDSGISWKGLFIKAGEGEEVKSVASGRVVFADWLRGFGNLMIIDHGDGYMSLYGNNQTLLKKVGEEVTAGDAIAAVGSSGGNADPGLYFELRHQSKPFDPLAWCIVK